MTNQKKMILFGSAVGAVLLILVIVLAILLGSGPKPGSETVDGKTASGSSRTSSSSSANAGDASDFEPGGEQSEAAGSGASNGVSNAASGNVSSTKTGNGSQSRQSSSGTQSTAQVSSKASNSKTFSILGDPTFENGFNALGLNVSDSGSAGKVIFDPLDTGGRQYWNLAQWGTKYSFGDPQYTKLVKNGNTYTYVNHNKEFGINYDNSLLTFKGLTSKLYSEPRKSGEEWFHLLIEQSFKTSDTRLIDLAKVNVTLSNRLTYWKDNMDGKANPGLHAAQFLMYFMVTNKDANSPDYNKYIWFGFPLFDNRMEWNPASVMLDKGTNSMMVGIGNEILYKANKKNNCWKNGKINASPGAEWSTFALDVLPNMKSALPQAQAAGVLKSTSESQLYLTGMNLGWEIPGSYDATMEVKDFSVMGTRK